MAGEGSTVMNTSEVTASGACPECNGRLVPDANETVCNECGLVATVDRIDRGPEWRSFPDDGRNPERTGAPLTRSRHDRGLSTEIGHSSRTRLTGRKRRRLARMRRHHNRARIATKADRNRVYAFTEIRRLVGALELPETLRDQSCVLFESAQNEDLIRGRSLEGFAAAAVYATCRTASVTRTVGEIVAEAKASERELKTAYDALNRELGLPTGPIDPAEFLPRFSTRLELDPTVERRARELATWASEEELAVGKDPSGVAGACLYAAAQELGADLTQQAAADVADVTPVTLRSTYYDLREESAAGSDSATSSESC